MQVELQFLWSCSPSAIVFWAFLSYNNWIILMNMSKKPQQSRYLVAHILVLLIGLGLFFWKNVRFGNLIFAQDASQETSQQTSALGTSSDSSQQTGSMNGSFDSSQQNLLDFQSQQLWQSQQQVDDNEMLQRQQFLQALQDQLQSAQDNYVTLHQNMNTQQSQLNGVQEQHVNLQGQIDMLNEQIQNTVEIANNVLSQIQQKEGEINSLKQNIEIRNIEIQNQRKLLADYLILVYEQENSLDDTTAGNTAVNIAKLLLSDQSPDEALKELHYYNILEETGSQIYDKLENLMQQQVSDQNSLEDSRNKYELLYNQLVDQKQTLEMQQQAKAQLLAETQGQESVYQQLINQSSQEQVQSLDDINTLRINLQFIQDKIAQLGDKFNPDDFKSVLSGETTNVWQYMKDNPNNAFQPMWPVSPSRGISAYFHDLSYFLALGVQHQAVDIRTPQSTPIHAPADGVVYKAKDNGYGFSYIILAHGGGFMTLYGHVSDIMVQDGQKILQGQVIGLSGGTPGTKGAGLLTTGPHLHFEVMKNGQPVDPLDYLPLEYLPVNSLPSKYLARITGDPVGVQRVASSNGVVTQENFSTVSPMDAP